MQESYNMKFFSMTSRFFLRTLFSLMLLAVLGISQRAQAQVQSAPPYQSPLRAQCMEEMLKDNNILTACKTQYSNEYHEQDARRAMADKKFVVSAYAAIWGILAVFVFLMWLRQRNLSQEIDRLERDLRKALKED